MSKVCTHEWESVSKLLTGTVLIIHRFWGSYGSSFLWKRNTFPI